jgi:hypothetical protein
VRSQALDAIPWLASFLTNTCETRM